MPKQAKKRGGKGRRRSPSSIAVTRALTRAGEKMSAGDGRLLTVPEAAAWLDCGADTVYRLVRNGQLAAVRVTGQCLRVAPGDLQTFVSERRIVTK